MRRLQVEHTTTYQYGSAVTLLPHRLLLRPREGQEIRIESVELTIAPAHQLRWHRDAYDNAVAIASFNESSRRLSIQSHVLLQHYQDWPLDFLVADHAVYFPFRYEPAESVDLGPYLESIFAADQPLLTAWLRPFWIPGQVVETYLLLEWLNKAIATGFVYRQREEPGVQSPATTLAQRTGSCRDFATLFIEACRSLGLAARFVSGYLCSPGSGLYVGATHAWAEVYLPGAGWKGFDSTYGQIVGNDHIAVAVHRHPESVPPVAGAFLAATAESPVMQVVVNVLELPA